MTATPAIDVRELTYRYGDRTALEAFTSQVATGHVCALVGHNGSGKSTLLRLLGGLLPVTSGTVTVAGTTPGSIEAKRAVSYVGDTPILYDDLSVGEHLEFVARLHGVEAWEPDARALARRLGIADRWDDLPATLSRGLRQRAALAVGFVRPSDVLLVDEPFVGLDQQGRDALLALVDERAAAGSTVVIATHQLDLLDRADRVLALKDGRLAFDGLPASLPADALAEDDVR